MKTNVVVMLVTYNIASAICTAICTAITIVVGHTVGYAFCANLICVTSTFSTRIVCYAKCVAIARAICARSIYAIVTRAVRTAYWFIWNNSVDCVITFL